MHQDWKHDGWEEEYVYTHIQVVHLWFWNSELLHCDPLAQVVFWALVSPVLEEVNPFLCAVSVSADTLLLHFGKEGSRDSDFHEPLLGVFPSRPCPLYAQETQLPTSSLLGLCSEVSGSGVAFHLLQYTTTLLRPFRPYSTHCACRTVLGVPDLLALPSSQKCWKPTRN